MTPAPPTEADTDRLLRALADSTRRLLLDRLRDHPGLPLGELLAGFSASRQALSKHLAALEAAGLVVTLWRGREKLHYLDPQPLQRLPARWLAPGAAQHEPAVQALRQALGAAAAPAAALDATGPAGLPAPEGGPGETCHAATQGAGARPVRERSPTAGGAAEVPAAFPGEVSPAGRATDRLGPALSEDLAAAPGPLLVGAAVRDTRALEAARTYLACTAQCIRQLAGALPDGPAAYLQPEGGGFSLAQHLWHLADLETLGWSARMQRLLSEDRPRLPGVNGDRLAVEGRYQERPWRGAARRFVAERRRTLATLAQFEVETLGRPAVFAGRRSTAGDVLAALVAHDQEHRTEMARLWATLHRGHP